MNEELKKELELKIKELKKNPFLYMSLGSKELFHSNFWAWLIETEKKFAKIFFNDIDLENIACVGREDGNRDLTIYMKKQEDEKRSKVYVVENKFKSMPTVEQIQKYQNDVEQRAIFNGGLLTGIEKPNFILPTNWNFISYKEISQGILNVVENIRDNISLFNYNLIKEYCGFLNKLQELLFTFIDYSKSKKCLNSEDFALLHEIKMDNVCKKLNMQEFANYVNDNLVKDFYKGIIVKTNFTRGESLIDVEFEKKYKEGFVIRIGIQIQGTQYRKRIVKRLDRDIGNSDIRILNNEELRREIFEDYKKKGWFKDKNQDCLFGRKTSQRGDYCSYCVENDYVSVYQYYNIENFSFEENLKNIRTDLEEAKEILESM